MTTRGKATEAEAPEPSALLDEAQTAGLTRLEGDVMPFGASALPAAADLGMAYRVADLIPTPAAWSEYAQVDIDELVNRDVILREVMFFDSAITEGAEWCIILLTDPVTGEQVTTATGSSIVVRKMRKLIAFPQSNGPRNMLPCVARVTKTPSKTKGYSDYYDLI